MLIVPGPDLAAAVTAVAADLADSEISVTPLGDDVGPRLAGHSVALLNRGTPSSLVTPDGTLHIALMRSCSAWPSGVWIDGDKRTAPDGSSFAWQHWSHTFEYALAAGPGDWRSAGFAAAGQEYNHPLLVTVTDAHPGARPGAASLCPVDGPAMLAALKPRGNPLAAGRDGTPARSAGVTARLRDLGGRAAGEARLSLFTGITGGQLTGLTEDSEGPALPVEDGGVVTAIGPAGTVTLALGVPAAGWPSGAAGAVGAAGVWAAGAGPAGVQPVLAARQGPGAGRQRPGRGAPVPHRPGAARRGPAHRGGRA